MTEINIQQDVQQLIHDVLTDDQIKSNPELIAAVAGLLSASIGLSSNGDENIELNVKPSPDNFL